ncbi:MAG: efflux transporter outer membrane subunit [bacterium]
MSRLFPLSAVFVAGALTACGGAPAAGPPPAPDAFLAPVEGEASPARWWVAFGEADLTARVEASLAGSPTLHAARARIAQARATARRAGADGGLSAEAELGAIARAPTDGGARALSFPAGISARYELDLFGRIDAVVEAATLDADASAAAFDAAGQTLAGQVASAWFQLAERQAQRAILADQTALNARVLGLVEERFRFGKAGAQDVLRQRQLVESAVGDGARLDAEIRVLGHRLAVLAGAPPAAPPALAPTWTLPPLPATGVPAALIQRRPDVRAAWLRVRAADQRVAGALAERFPRLSFSASLSSGHVPLAVDNWLAQLAGNLVAPLLDGGRREAEVDRTRAAVQEALATYRLAVLEALSEVEDALARATHQVELLASLDRQLELATGAAERARDRYAAGAASYVDVLDAVRTLQALERARLSARRELFQHRIDLYRALAGDLPAAEGSPP